MGEERSIKKIMRNSTILLIALVIFVCVEFSQSFRVLTGSKWRAKQRRCRACEYRSLPIQNSRRRKISMAAGMDPLDGLDGSGNNEAEDDDDDYDFIDPTDDDDDEDDIDASCVRIGHKIVGTAESKLENLIVSSSMDLVRDQLAADGKMSTLEWLNVEYLEFFLLSLRERNHETFEAFLQSLRIQPRRTTALSSQSKLFLGESSSSSSSSEEVDPSAVVDMLCKARQRYIQIVMAQLPLILKENAEATHFAAITLQDGEAVAKRIGRKPVFVPNDASLPEESTLYQRLSILVTNAALRNIKRNLLTKDEISTNKILEQAIEETQALSVLAGKDKDKSIYTSSSPFLKPGARTSNMKSKDASVDQEMMKKELPRHLIEKLMFQSLKSAALESSRGVGESTPKQAPTPSYFSSINQRNQAKRKDDGQDDDDIDLEAFLSQTRTSGEPPITNTAISSTSARSPNAAPDRPMGGNGNRKWSKGSQGENENQKELYSLGQDLIDNRAAIAEIFHTHLSQINAMLTTSSSSSSSSSSAPSSPPFPSNPSPSASPSPFAAVNINNADGDESISSEVTRLLEQIESGIKVDCENADDDDAEGNGSDFFTPNTLKSSAPPPPANMSSAVSAGVHPPASGSGSSNDLDDIDAAFLGNVEGRKGWRADGGAADGTAVKPDSAGARSAIGVLDPPGSEPPIPPPDKGDSGPEEVEVSRKPIEEDIAIGSIKDFEDLGSNALVRLVGKTNDADGDVYMCLEALGGSSGRTPFRRWVRYNDALTILNIVDPGDAASTSPSSMPLSDSSSSITTTSSSSLSSSSLSTNADSNTHSSNSGQVANEDDSSPFFGGGVNLM